jgi:hypothetical protein
VIEQINNPLNFFAQFLVGGQKGTGLTITCSVYLGSNSAVLVTGQAATEIGSTGIYRYTLPSSYVTQEDDYVALFSEAAATADQTDVPSLWNIGRGGLENLTLIGSGDFAVVAPVSSDGATLNLIRGDDYLEAQDRALEFTSSDWPDLTGATEVIMTIRRRAEGFTSGGTSDPVLIAREDVSGSRVVGAGSQTVVFELDNTDGGEGAPEEGSTDDLLVGTGAGKYDIQVTLSSGEIVTIVTGVVNVTEDQTRE